MHDLQYYLYSRSKPQVKHISHIQSRRPLRPPSARRCDQLFSSRLTPRRLERFAMGMGCGPGVWGDSWGEVDAAVTTKVEQADPLRLEV